MTAKKSKMTVEKVEMHQNNVTVHDEIFQIVNNGGTYFIGCANNLVTQKNFASVEEAKAFIDSKPWELIINVSCLLMRIKEK